jgi:NADH-quinone oxidoreductase subunit F
VKGMSIIAYLRSENEKLPKELFYEYEYRIMVGISTCSLTKRAEEVKKIIEKDLIDKKMDAKLAIVGCNGMCYSEVLVEVARMNGPNILYTNINPENAHLILDHFINYISNNQSLFQSKIQIKELKDEPFYALQERKILEYVGRIDPYSLNEYLMIGGYEGLKKALSMSPEGVINEVLSSGLRGRGGAGFPTGKKWKFAYESKSDQKYAICNADEGDPGAFMNRLTAEGSPFMIIEGLTIMGYAIGANKGYIFVRAEKPLMAERLETAITLAKKKSFLGENIMNSNFSFDIEVILSAGAFVCGEETAMIAAIEGKRAMPRPRPPYPASKGLWNKPTCINNVETLAHVSLILKNGSNWFSQVGSEKSKGTKVFCLTGSIAKSGAVEVPLGTTIKKLVFDIGGGSSDGSIIKAVQIGGPSGGCIPSKYFDYELDYESLQSLGAIMGSGGLVVLTESNCMVDVAKYFLTFTSAESCGKCTPCRIGLTKMLNKLIEITNGKGRIEDIDYLINISRVIIDSSLCALGQTAPNPILTTIKYFKEEYLEHIIEKKCEAKVCTSLLKYEIDQEKCKKCMVCVKNCPNKAIEVKEGEIIFINQDKCIKCGTCRIVCPFNAIKVS